MKALIILLGILATSAFGAGSPPRHIVNFPAGTTTWCLLFPAPPESEVFTDAMTAIEVEDVVCDGQRVEPEVQGLAHGPSRIKVKIHGAAAPIYQLTVGFFMSWIDPSRPPSEARIHHYRIPESAEMIEVTYRVRYPDRKRSNSMVVCFVATRDVTHRLHVRSPQ